MTGSIRRCPEDGTYTFSFNCPRCGSSTVTAHPARFSPQDPYGRYRRVLKAWTTSG